MLNMISNFFSMSLATLSIYDVLVIILFILAVILCTISGIIIVSTRVKKINIELDKSKAIQEVNDKIIQNRLDLILSKLSNNEQNIKKENDILALEYITNNKIKQAVSFEDSNKTHIESSKEAIPLPPPSKSQEQNNKENNLTLIDNKNLIHTSSSEVEKINIDINPTDVNLNNNPKDTSETITVVDTFENSHNNSIDIQKISDEYHIKKQDTSISQSPNFDKGEAIILSNNDEQLNSLIKDTNNISPNNKEEEEGYTEGIKITNDMLNNMPAFSKKERFKITKYITEDGDFIKCLIRKKNLLLDYNTLVNQLIIHRLLKKYRYPADLIELNCPIHLKKGVVQRVSTIVLNNDNHPYIIVSTTAAKAHKKFELLKSLSEATKAPFIIWSNGKKLKYYYCENDDIEEINEIPKYNNELHRAHNQIPHIHTQNHGYKISSQSSLNTQSNNPQNISNFSKDNYNIYRNNPYMLSTEYQDIIKKYRTPYNNINLHNYSDNSQMNNFNYLSNHRLLNNTTLPQNYNNEYNKRISFNNNYSQPFTPLQSNYNNNNPTYSPNLVNKPQSHLEQQYYSNFNSNIENSSINNITSRNPNNISRYFGFFNNFTKDSFILPKSQFYNSLKVR